MKFNFLWFIFQGGQGGVGEAGVNGKVGSKVSDSYEMFLRCFMYSAITHLCDCIPLIHTKNRPSCGL
jgi:hypothetical protein